MSASENTSLCSAPSYTMQRLEIHAVIAKYELRTSSFVRRARWATYSSWVMSSPPPGLARHTAHKQRIRDGRLRAGMV